MLNFGDERPAKKSNATDDGDVILAELEYDTPFVAISDYAEIKHTSHHPSVDEQDEETLELGGYSSTTQKLFADPEFEKAELARRKEENEQREKLYEKQRLEDARLRGIEECERQIKEAQAKSQQPELATEQLRPGHEQIIENDSDFTTRLTISAGLNILAIAIMILQATFNTKFAYIFNIATYVAAILGLVCFFIPYPDRKAHRPTPDQQDFFVALTIVPVICIMNMITLILNQLFTTPFIGQLAAVLITISLTSMVHYDYLAENGIGFNLLYPTLKVVIYIVLSIIPNLGHVNIINLSNSVALAFIPAIIMFFLDWYIGRISRHTA